MSRKVADALGPWAAPRVRYQAAKGGYLARKCVEGVTIEAFYRGPDSAATRRQAEVRYAAKVDARLKQIEHERGRTAAEWIEAVYLPYLSREVALGNRSYQTERAYRSKFYCHIKDALGRLRLEEIRPHHVDNLLRGVMERRVARYRRDEPAFVPKTTNSAATANDVRTTLRSMLAYAAYLGLIEYNPVARAKPLKEEPHAVEPVSAKELTAFLTELKGHPLYLAVLLTLATGLRSGEVRGLQWGNIDLDIGVIHLAVQIQRIAGKDVLRPLKGRRVRLVPIPAVLIEPLRQSRQRALENGHQICFPARNTIRYLNAGTINNTVRVYMGRAGITVRKFHALRHTCASLLAAEGASVYEVAALLGHSNPTVTQRVYTHLFPQTESRVAAKMDGILGTILGTPPTPADADPSRQGKPSLT